MVIEFRLPDLGESTTEGEVVQLLVHEGDRVEKDQPILELETDKALLEVPSPASGRILKIHTAPGRKLRVDELIVTLEESAAGAEPPPQPAAPAQPEPKAAPPPPAAPAARREIKAQPEEPAVGAPAKVVQMEAPPSGAVQAAPSVRKFARELGVDLGRLRGTGPGGRISKDDVKNFVRSAAAAPAARVVSAPGAPSIAAPPLPDFAQWGPIEVRPLSNVRKKTMESLSLSWALIPHVTQVDEADITELMSLRQRHAERAREKGGKLTVTVFALKAVISALKEYPQFNATLDPGNEALILKRYYHLGIAVDTEHGLLVPVIRDVDKKHLLDLSAELFTISERARRRKTTLEELRGATFTITNLGGYGGTAFTPIIHHPEVAILGLARTQERLVMSGAGIEKRLILPLCLSYDHRIIDGADAVRFTRKVASMLEDPALLLLEA